LAYSDVTQTSQKLMQKVNIYLFVQRLMATMRVARRTLR
jgi:hypothetical protein